MTLRSSLLLAFRFLGFTKKRGGVEKTEAGKSLRGSVIGIAVSLVPLIIGLVLIDGMIDGMSARMIELSSYHVQAIDFNPDTPAEAYRYYVEDLSEVPGVRQIIAERDGTCIAVGKKGRTGGLLRAVDPAFFEDHSVVSLLTAVAGTLDLQTTKSAVIGEEIARAAGLEPGDKIRIMTMKKNAQGRQVPSVSFFTVAGIFSSGYRDLDSLWIFVPFQDGFPLVQSGSGRCFLGIKATDGVSAEKLCSSIRYYAPEGFVSYTWKALNQGQFKSFETTKMLLMFIMVLILIVASVNISAALVMLVMERRKEIAVLKSMGASPRGITAAFIFAGTITGFGGVLLGLPVGILGGIHINTLLKGIEYIVNFVYVFFIRLTGNPSDPAPVKLLDPAYYLESIPVSFNSTELFAICAGTMILSLLVSLSPAYRAGKEKPLDILRKF